MLCKFSSDFLMDTFTLVDNKFIIEYLPYAKDKEIRAYIYGLYQCTNPAEATALDDICKVLDVSEDELLGIFAYWAECGLVRILSTSPLEVQFLSNKRGNQPPRKFKAEKYGDFNMALQQLFPSRQVLPNEYNEYYNFLESCKMEQSALLMIVQYCIDQKGVTVRYPYVLAVAKNWWSEGVKTVMDVEEKLNEYEAQSDSMRQLLSALGRKGGADLDEKQMLLKWTKNWGFELNAVVFAAKHIKNKTFKRLDVQLDDYYRKNIFTEPEMKDYEAHYEALKDLTVQINKTLGVFYESLDNEIETYTVPWTEKGFNDDALITIAHFCFLGGIKTLDGMNNHVNRFFKLGLITKEGVSQHIALQIASDEKIKHIIEATGRTRFVTNTDRESYKLWSAVWGFSDEVIYFAAECCARKTYPTAAMSQLLESWRAQNVETVAQAKAIASQASSGAKPQTAFVSREYSKEDLSSIFKNNDLFGDDN